MNIFGEKKTKKICMIWDQCFGGSRLRFSLYEATSEQNQKGVEKLVLLPNNELKMVE